MPRKTKIIFITVFILVGIAVLGFYFYKNKSGSVSTDNTTNSDYQPFLGSSTTGQGGTNSGAMNTTGSEDTTSLPTNPVSESPSISQTNKFHQITDFSVAGAVFFQDARPLPVSEVSAALEGGEKPPEIAPTKNTKKKATPTKPEKPLFEMVPSLRYVERVTGHIDQIYLDTKAVGKVSNSTIASIYEAIFDGSASSVIYRYLSVDSRTITSFIATLGSASGEFLPNDILDVSISPDKTKLFYITKSSSGVVGTVKPFKDTKKTQVWSSSLTEWLSQWVTDQKVYLTTKASASVDGSLFSLNIANGVLTKVFGGVKGLTTLANKDGSLVLYSSSISGGSRLGIFNTKNHTAIEISLYSLPEKCVWSSDAIHVYCAVPSDMGSREYPDSWYQGLVSFNDHFVRIDTSTGSTNTIADSLSATPVDATHLFLDDKEGQIFFTNKKDSTLWSLDLN